MFRLPEITYPLAVDTIGKTLALGEEITLVCYSCTGPDRHRRLNLVKLVSFLKAGMNYSCEDSELLKVVFCPACRAAGRYASNIGFIHEALSLPHSPWPRQANAYARAKGGG